mmetsp:Transcript_23878/g.34235  ORF Transcript_23878/g.34235 Transcript_23878/m.34235 type:complete len:507 (+) Transcript_23878:47-1567(+)
MCNKSKVADKIVEADVNTPSERTFTLKELASSYNTPKNAYASVHGTVIDITAFASRHPGGDIILLSAGRDATVLFETYHPRLQNGLPKSIVETYAVGHLLIKDEKAVSCYNWSSGFYPTLKSRVSERLRQLNRPRRGGYEIKIKALFLLVGFWFSLVQMMIQPFHVACIWSCAMGAFASFIGTCIQHDGNHGAFSTSKYINKIAGWTLDMIGASAYTWEMQHMLGHHPYTNLLHQQGDQGDDQESDPDVFSSYPLLRMHPAQEWSPMHMYQHWYAPILFAFMTLSKVFQQDYQVILDKRLYHIDATCRYGSIWNRLRFYVMKVITSLYMMFLPCYFHGVIRGLFLFVIGHLVCGELLATMFIVNHVIEGVAFAQKSEGEEALAPRTAKGDAPMLKSQAEWVDTAKAGRVPLNDWAAVQCQTSVNWSSGSWFWNNFSGGLNHQIEHHLFPSICHSNYPYIQDVVEGTCAEFGVPYLSEPNLWIAYRKMLRHLSYLGNDAWSSGKKDQ